MSARRHRLAALGFAVTALGALGAHAVLIGRHGREAARVNDIAIALGLLALGGGLAALRRLARARRLTLSETARSLLLSAGAGIAFLVAVYHLSGLFRFLAPVRAALDALLPAAVLASANLIPGLLLLVAAELLWRRRPAPRKTTTPAPSSE